MIVISLFLTACGSQTNSTSKSQGKVNIYTTVYPLQDFAKKIGGDYVEVHTVYPPGSDEHTFEPTQKDMMNLADSDLFFYIGLGLEGFVEKSKQTLKDENVTMVATADSLNQDELKKSSPAPHEEGESEHHLGDINPHVWLDPVYAKQLALTIEKSLIKTKPDHEKEFKKNYLSLSKDLDGLNNEFQATLSKVPKKEFIVSHAAYGYWESRYGLKQLSVSGFSTSNEPSQKQLLKLVEEAKNQNLSYFLVEQNSQTKLDDVIQRELGAKRLTLHNLAVLTDEDISNHEDYFSLMHHDLSTLKTALSK